MRDESEKLEFITTKNEAIPGPLIGVYNKTIQAWGKKVKSPVDEVCILCGQKFDGSIEGLGVCDSHSVPKSILRNIADNRQNVLIMAEALKKEGSTNEEHLMMQPIPSKAGLFYCIHSKCDNAYFSAFYETHMKQLENKEMSASIHLKNLLTTYYRNQFHSHMIEQRVKEYSDTIKKLSIAIENHDTSVNAIEKALDFYKTIEEAEKKRNIQYLKDISRKHFVFSKEKKTDDLSEEELTNFYIRVFLIVDNQSSNRHHFNLRNEAGQLFLKKELPGLINRKVEYERELEKYNRELIINNSAKELLESRKEKAEGELKKYKNFLDGVINYKSLLGIRRILGSISLYRVSNNINFRTIFYKELNYVVPVAFQDSIQLFVDFEGNIINSPLLREDIEGYYIDLCIFPQKTSSIVYMFSEKEMCEGKLKGFINSFSGLTEDEKLNCISYIVFLYADVDRIFISPNADKAILPVHNKAVKAMCDSSDMMIVECDPYINRNTIINKYKAKYTLSKFRDKNGLPNILDSKYKIK